MPKMKGGERAQRTGISLHPKLLAALRSITREQRRRRNDDQEDVNHSRVLASLIWFMSGDLENGEADVESMRQEIASLLVDWRGKKTAAQVASLIMAAYEKTPYDDDTPPLPTVRQRVPRRKVAA